MVFLYFFVQLISVFVFKDLRQKIGKELMYVTLFLIVGYSPYVFVFVQRFYESSAKGTWIPPVTNLGQLHHVLTLLTNNNSVLFLLVIALVWYIFNRILSQTIQNEVVKKAILLISIFFLFYSISIVAPMPYYWEFTSKPWAMISYLIFIVFTISWIVRTLRVSVLKKMILLWFSLPLLIMFVCSFKIPMFIDRYYSYTTPAFFILIAILLSYFSEKSQVKMYYVFIMLLLITHVRNEPNNRDVKPMIEKIISLKTDGTAVILCPDYFNLNYAYYYDQSLFKNIGNESIEDGIVNRLENENVYGITHINQLNKEVISKCKKIIYLDAGADFMYPKNEINQVIATKFKHLDTFNFGDAFTLHVYE